MSNIISKICYKCSKHLDISLFSKYKASKDGYKTNCKSCIKDYRLANIVHITERDKKYRDNNRERISRYNSQYRTNYPDRVTAKDANRRSKKIKASPNWLSKNDKQMIKDIYKQCKYLSETTGVLHHVDHIVPLNSKIVCGLHVPWNLQILTAEKNLLKGNKLLEQYGTENQTKT